MIAVEEPESHLHPRAIHELRDVLKELTEKHQVIISTHCPFFVDRTWVRNNIIVCDNKAHPAKSVQEVRDVLGVRAADNLRHAEVVLVVEGEGDRVALRALISSRSPKLKTAFDNNTLVIDSLAGGSNLSYKLGLLRDSLVLCQCFLDNDDCGRKAFKKAQALGLADHSDVTFSTCERMLEAEIEDLYDLPIYHPLIKNHFRVDLNSPSFKSNKKWSARMKDAFTHQGKLWDDNVEEDLKRLVARAVAESPSTAINAHREGPLVALIKNLEAALETVTRKG